MGGKSFWLSSFLRNCRASSTMDSLHLRRGSSLVSRFTGTGSFLGLFAVAAAAAGPGVGAGAGACLVGAGSRRAFLPLLLAVNNLLMTAGSSTSSSGRSVRGPRATRNIETPGSFVCADQQNVSSHSCFQFLKQYISETTNFKASFTLSSKKVPICCHGIMLPAMRRRR